MKILLLQSYLGRPERIVMPIGLAYIATMLGADHDVKILDMNLCRNPYEDLEVTIRDYHPEIIGISLRNVDNQQRIGFFYYYQELPKTLKLIKDVAPESKIVIGGPGFSMFAEKIMQRHHEIDFGIYLEGEYSFPALLGNIDDPRNVPNLYYRNGGILSFTFQGKLPDIEKLPIPRKDILNINVYKQDKWAIGVQTKRGCPLQCAYCNYPILNGLTVRMRDPVQIVDEIEDLVKHHGVTSFMFADGIFSSPFHHVKSICDEIVYRRVHVQWAAWCNVMDISEAFLETVTKAGCNHIVISPDALSQTALNGLNKSFTRQNIKETLDLLNRWQGIHFGFGFFLTVPGETIGGYFATIFFFIKEMLLKMIGMRKGGCGLSWIRIEPNTRIHQTAIDEGLIRCETDLIPEKINDLKKLFYINPKLRFLDTLSVFLVKIINLKKTV